MKLQTDAFRWSADEGGGWLCFRCQRPQEILSKVEQGKAYDVEIKKHRKRRSLDANAFLWVLLDRLADALTYVGDRPITKEEIYRRLIPEIPGVSETVCVVDRAVDALISGWQHNGLGWIAETMPSKLTGCTNVILYSGSSVYDTKQMSRLLDLVIAECKQVGIETATPEELARLEGYDAQIH